MKKRTEKRQERRKDRDLLPIGIGVVGTGLALYACLEAFRNKKRIDKINEPQDEIPEDLVIESGLLSGNWKMSGSILRLENENDSPENLISYETTINIEHNNTDPEFVVTQAGIDTGGVLRPVSGKMVGLLEGDGNDITLTLADYDDNGLFTFKNIERNPMTGEIIKFSSGKYTESGFRSDNSAQKPTVGKLILEANQYILDAQMSDIPENGRIDKIYIFRNHPLDLRNRTITGIEGPGYGAILVIGYGGSDFTDFKNISGLESIEPATTQVTHIMENVTLQNLGGNSKDINALTLVNLDNTHKFENIIVNNSQDDGIEIFGGKVNMRNITIKNATDDYFDTDYAHSGSIENLNLIQTDTSKGMSLIECGNSNGSTTTTFTNVTFNGGTNFAAYTNNSSDPTFNIKAGSNVTINGTKYTAPTDTI